MKSVSTFELLDTQTQNGCRVWQSFQLGTSRHMILVIRNNFKNYKTLVKMERIEVGYDEFHFNILNNIKRLRKKNDFSDVTLVSDDYIHFPAHKVVLAASSEYFRRILAQNNQSQPYLCLIGVGSEDLSIILDYVYNGQTSILKNDLQKFLQVAKQLKLDGLEMEELGPVLNKKEDTGFLQIKDSFSVMEHGIGMGSSDQDYLTLDSIDSMNFLEMEEPVNDVTLDFQQSLPLENEKKE